MMNKACSSIMAWVKKNRRELIVLLFILLLSAGLRLFKIAGYMTFLGDEGRDAVVLKRMIVDFDLRLIGPVTSIGNMYLGPLYYYLILPSMFISGLSPVGPSVFVALLGVVTTGLIWWLGRLWFGRWAGLAAAFLYSISAVAIIYARSSWNPNVMPFFSLIMIWGLWQVWQKRQYLWLPVVGVALSFALQSHYLGLLLLPTFGLFWLFFLKRAWQEKESRRPFMFSSLGCLLAILLLTVLPLVWFDLRHGFINAKAFREFFTIRQTTVNLKFYKGFVGAWELYLNLITRLLGGKDEFWGLVLAVVLTVFFGLRTGWGVWRRGWGRFWAENQPLVLILVWLGMGLLGLANYKQHIYDHYFGFLFPIPFLLTGFLIQVVVERARRGWIIALAVLASLTVLAYQVLPVRQSPNNQLARTEKVAQFVMETAGDEPFNLALIAKCNYEAAYAFFLEVWQAPMAEIAPQRSDETITDQLFVICEERPCEPINHPKAEIAMFGWSKIDQQWTVEGLEVYRLVHTQ